MNALKKDVLTTFKLFNTSFIILIVKNTYFTGFNRAVKCRKICGS